MKNKNPKSHSMDSSSELSTKSQSQLRRQDFPHYYEVKIPNHPNGVPQMHCGNIKDAERLLEMYPDATIEKIYLPHPPQTVDVPYVMFLTWNYRCNKSYLKANYNLLI